MYQRMKQFLWRPGWKTGLILVIVIISLILPRVLALGRYVTADEPTWEIRSANFYYALSKKDYKDTYQTAHPGVTTMWEGAIAFHLKFPNYQEAGQSDIGDAKLIKVFHRHGSDPMEVLATARLMVVMTIVITLSASFLFAKSLFGTLPSLVGFLLIAFDPFHVAHSRFLQTNGLLSSFIFFSFLAYLYYLQTRKWYALIISGIAAGLSFMTVSPGLLLIPIVGLTTLFDLYEFRTKLRDYGIKRLVAQVLIPLTLWGVVSLITVIVIWPAMWTQPLQTASKIASYSMNAVEGEVGGAQLVEAYNTENGLDSNYLYFYPLSYLWRGTPIVLIGLVLVTLVILLDRSSILKPGTRRNIIALGLLVVVFTIIMSMGTKKTDRYYLPVYLPLDIIAAIGWVSAARYLTKINAKFESVNLLYLVSIIVIAAQMLVTVRHYPYYLTYYNPMLGGGKKAQESMIIGWGEGLNEAALYLREIPGVKKLNILSWYPLAFNWYSFGLGFEAQPIRISAEADKETLKEFLLSDYAIIYINQVQRNYPRQLLEYLEKLEPEYSIWLKGIEYVRIYKLSP